MIIIRKTEKCSCSYLCKVKTDDKKSEYKFRKCAKKESSCFATMSSGLLMAQNTGVDLSHIKPVPVSNNHFLTYKYLRSFIK